MDSSVDPIDPYAALNSSDRVNPTNRSKADKDQKEFARTLKKKLRDTNEHDDAEDVVELSDATADTHENDETPGEETAGSKEPATDRRHVDLKA